MKKKLLLIDNYDSFTYNLAQYFWELDCEVLVHRNDKITLSFIKQINPTHIVISPGPGTPADSGISLQVIESFHAQKPILGVCLGHQCLGEFFGANIIRAPLPKHGKTSQIINERTGLFGDLPSQFQVTRYHSLIIAEDSIDQNIWHINARSLEDNLIMGIHHKTYNLHGLQFHPESIMTEHGHHLLDNFLKY